MNVHIYTRNIFNLLYNITDRRRSQGFSVLLKDTSAGWGSILKDDVSASYTSCCFTSCQSSQLHRSVLILPRNPPHLHRLSLPASLNLSSAYLLSVSISMPACSIKSSHFYFLPPLSLRLPVVPTYMYVINGAEQGCAGGVFQTPCVFSKVPESPLASSLR